eukprot:6181508-Pleurochrysis_carterae.AAC.1
MGITEIRSRQPLVVPHSRAASAGACRRRNCLLLPLRAQTQPAGSRAPGLNPARLLARLHAF